MTSYRSSTSRADVVEGRRLAGADHGVGDLPGEALLAVLPQHPGQVGAEYVLRTSAAVGPPVVPSMRMSSGASLR